MFNYGANQWPAQQPNFRPVMLAYLDVMLDLSARMMRGLALSLELPEDYFANFCAGRHGERAAVCIIRRIPPGRGQDKRAPARIPILAA